MNLPVPLTLLTFLKLIKGFWSFCSCSTLASKTVKRLTIWRRDYCYCLIIQLRTCMKTSPGLFFFCIFFSFIEWMSCLHIHIQRENDKFQSIFFLLPPLNLKSSLFPKVPRIAFCTSQCQVSCTHKYPFLFMKLYILFLCMLSFICYHYFVSF